MIDTERKRDTAHKIVAGVLADAEDRSDDFALVIAIVQQLEEAGLLQGPGACPHRLRRCGHYCHHTFCCYCQVTGPPLSHEQPCHWCAVENTNG